MTARRYLLLIFAAAVAGVLIFALTRREPAPVAAPETTSGTETVDPFREQAAAAHILVAHIDSKPTIPGVTRTRDEARERAVRIAASLASKSAPFGDLARRYSDDPNAEVNDGYLGVFKRGILPLALEVPLFDLEVGHFDGTVETEHGFHIVMRQPIRRYQGHHILIAWSGARGSTSGVRRNRDQAALLADEVLAMLATDEVDFCDLASRFSDDAESRFECGWLGVIEPAMLPRPLETAFFGLKAGRVSDKVETEYGFHILKRAD